MYLDLYSYVHKIGGEVVFVTTQCNTNCHHQHAKKQKNKYSFYHIERVTQFTFVVVGIQMRERRLSVPMTRVTILGASFLVVIFVSLYTSTATARTNGFFNNKPGPGIKDEDPYKVLGVRRTAAADDVQRAYRQKARETHRKWCACTPRGIP